MKLWWQKNWVQWRAEAVLFWALLILVAGTLLFWVTAGFAQTPCTYTTVFLPDGRVITVMTCCNHGMCTTTTY